MFFASRRISQRNKKIQELLSLSGQHAYQLALQYTNDQDTAKDIVQQSLIKILESNKWPTDGINYWFLRIVRNTSLDATKKNTTRKRLSGALKHHETKTRAVLSTTEIIEKEQQATTCKTTIEKALENLSAEQREIIILKDIQGYSYAQIETILNIAKGTVMSRLHRARLALKEEVLNHASM